MKTRASNSLEYKTKIIGSVSDDNNALDTIVVPLKSISNFYRFLDSPLINCEVELDNLWSRNCIISLIYRRLNLQANPPNPRIVPTQTTEERFK